jgi:hypothetical protein
MRVINIINRSTIVDADELSTVVAACQIQLDRDFILWGGTKQNKLVMRDDDRTKERIYVIDDTNQAGKLGMHTKVGAVPVGFVFARTAEVMGMPWSVILSHELLEQVVDPLLNKGSIGPVNRQNAMVAMEVCDPVYGSDYDINGVKVANFVQPLWFSGRSAGKVMDHKESLKRPFQIGSSGYVLYTSNLNTWHITYGNSGRIRKHAAQESDRFSRLARRNQK